MNLFHEAAAIQEEATAVHGFTAKDAVALDTPFISRWLEETTNEVFA